MPPWLYFSRPTNTAFHSLCTSLPIPPNFRSLLGLGLNFCVRQPFTPGPSSFDSSRFERDAYIRYIFAGDNSPPPPLFLPSKWQPATDDIHIKYRVRIHQFMEQMKSLFTKKRVPSNLLPSQEYALRLLKNDLRYIIRHTDKNLGPAVLERSTYIKQALSEHLSNSLTYRRLTPTIAQGRVCAVERMLRLFVESFFPHKHDSTRNYLLRSIKVKDPFSHFYLLPNLHKTPWKTRPIISTCGSLLHGLGKWVNLQLQSVIAELPFVFRCSLDVRTRLEQCSPFPLNAKFFKMDAVSMYTNINTKHALAVIGDYLRHHRHIGIDAKALIRGLTILMEHNVFCFGDVYFVQQTGTAMGTPPAPPYATLYFYIHERSVIPMFPEIKAYRRLIDDGLGVWCPDSSVSPTDDAARFQSFQNAINNFGKLKWEFSERSTATEFLELDLLLSNGYVSTRLFEKALNLYLYLPPHSAHPPGVLKGLIFG
jgi:hypothetical protein